MFYKIINYHSYIYHYFGDNNIKIKILYILILSIFFLLILTILFTIFTIFLRYKNDRRGRFFFSLERRWTKDIFKYLNDEIKKDLIFKKIGSSEETFFIDFLYRFEQRLDGKTKYKIKELARPYLKHIESGINSKSAEIRAKTLMSIGSLDDGHYFESIVKLLDDESPLVSILAAKILANLGRVDAFDDVIMHLDRYQNWSKDLVARNLSFFGIEVSEQLRFVFFNKDFNITTRVIVADTLVLLNDFQIHPIAFETLKTEKSKEIKAACLRLLSNTNSEEYINYVRFLTSDESFLVRLYAVKLLGKVGNISDHKIFINMLKDDEPWIRIYAARGLKNTRGIDVLIELSKDKQYGYDAVKQVLSED